MQNFLPIINTNITSNIFERFGDISINSSRITIFRSAINFILEKPFFGWGAGTFFLIYSNQEVFFGPPLWFIPQHAHNLFLEMAFNFGIPASILITCITINLLLKAIPISFSLKNKNDSFNIDKAWGCGALVVFFMYISDVPFYDGKISLLTSILFAGLRCISVPKKM